MNNLQESILDAMKVFVKDSTSKLNFPLTLECEVIRCTDENKGEYEVKYLENNFLAYCQYKGFKYNPNDVVYVLIPRGDFSKTKVILGLERDELIESDLTDIEPNPAETPSADLDTIKIGDTVYNIAGTQPTEDIVKDVRVNGSSVVDNEKVANITVPTDTVTTTQMNNAINNATRDLVSETEMNSAIGEAISDLATETYVDNAVSPKANISDVNTALSYKADKSELVGLATETYVDNAVAPKANTSDVNTALALKANSADVTSALALKADKTELIDVEANPSDSGTEDLTKLKVGNTVYDIPSGGGGTEVVANPSGTATDDLNTIKIGNTIYDIPGGESGGEPGLNVIETYGSAGSKSYTITKAGLYAIFATVTYQGSCTITLPNDAITVYSNDLTVSSRISKYLIVELPASSTVTIAMTVGQWNGCCSGIIALKNMEINQVADSVSKADTTASLTLPDDDKMYLVLATCAARNSSDARDNTTGGNPKYDEKVNPSSLSKLHLSLCKGSDSPTYSMYAYDGGIASVIAYELKKDLVYVEANPEGQATEDLDTILIDDTIYNLKGSGYTTLSDYYSTEERVVGRWIDGKPLYQKTWDFGSNPVIIPSNTWVDTPITVSSINAEKFISALATSESTNSWNVLTAADQTYVRLNQTRSGQMTVKYLTLTYTKSTDTAGTGPTPGNLIYLPALYSEEERVVGVWTDGKPLYQKTYHFSTRVVLASGVNENILQLPSEMVLISGIAHDTDYSFVQNQIQIGKNNGYLYIYNAKNGSIGLCDITLQYIKSTDQPGSGKYLPDGQYSHHYSTSEHIVGTWIDGSTIYERTWDLGSEILIQNNSWYTTNISNIEMSKVIRVDAMNATGTYRSLEASCDTGNYVQLITTRTNTTDSVQYLTLQYTKSV